VLTNAYLEYAELVVKLKNYDHKGDKEKAGQFATLADKNASAETSGLRYHKYLGIVKDRDDLLDDLVKEDK